MLRSAEEILMTYYTREMSEPYGRVPHDVIIKSINAARKEVIEEIANLTDISDDNFNPVITKDEILNILNQLK